MPTPFPGMDPYLEHPSLWPDVHNTMAAALRTELVSVLRPRYAVRLHERSYLREPDGLVLVGCPEVAVAPVRAAGRAPEVPDRIREVWLEVRSPATNEVVTVVERGARAGDVEAMAAAARCLYWGIGTRRDLRAALRWNRRAAAGGNAEACYVVGRAHELGEGARRDLRLALQWYVWATRSGHRDAAVAQRKLTRQLERAAAGAPARPAGRGRTAPAADPRVVGHDHGRRAPH